MHRTEHARQIADRFRELVEETADIISAEHYDELALLIEAGIDAAVVETLERTADKLDSLSASLRSNAEVFD